MAEIYEQVYEPFVPSTPAKFVVLGILSTSKGEKIIVFSTFRWMDEEDVEKHLDRFLGIKDSFKMISCIPADGTPFYIHKTKLSAKNFIMLKEVSDDES